jgi:hypothetical protein
MARATLAAIIARVRLLIADKGTPPQFSDDELQDTLDQRRTDVRYLELTPAETIAPGGGVTWLDYYAPFDLLWWEGDAQLVDNRFAPLTPLTSDLSGGHWTFATNQRPPVWIVGKAFDLYAASADALEQWIAALKLEYSTTQETNVYQRNERITTMTDLAASYRAKERVRTVTMTRPDTMTQEPQSSWVTPAAWR